MACFCVTACHVQMKGKAYNKFSLPANKKKKKSNSRQSKCFQAERCGQKSPQETTKEPQQNKSINLSITYTCIAPFMKNGNQCLTACQTLAFKALPQNQSLSSPKYKLRLPALTRCPCSPSLSGFSIENNLLSEWLWLGQVTLCSREGLVNNAGISDSFCSHSLLQLWIQHILPECILPGAVPSAAHLLAGTSLQSRAQGANKTPPWRQMYTNTPLLSRVVWKSACCMYR